MHAQTANTHTHTHTHVQDVFPNKSGIGMSYASTPFGADVLMIDQTYRMCHYLWYCVDKLCCVNK